MFFFFTILCSLWKFRTPIDKKRDFQRLFEILKKFIGIQQNWQIISIKKINVRLKGSLLKKYFFRQFVDTVLKLKSYKDDLFSTFCVVDFLDFYLTEKSLEFPPKLTSARTVPQVLTQTSGACSPASSGSHLRYRFHSIHLRRVYNCGSGSFTENPFSPLSVSRENSTRKPLLKRTIAVTLVTEESIEAALSLSLSLSLRERERERTGKVQYNLVRYLKRNIENRKNSRRPEVSGKSSR